MGRAVTDLAACDMAVFDDNDGMLGMLGGNIVDNDLAVAAELCGDALCDLPQSLQPGSFYDLSPPSSSAHRRDRRGKYPYRYIIP